MPKSRLAELLEEQVSESLAVALRRRADDVTDTLVADLLRKPEFRERMEELLRAAFDRALQDLTTPQR